MSLRASGKRLIFVTILSAGWPLLALAGTSGQPIAAESGVCHVLLRGQTLYSLSRAYGISLETLSEVNEIVDPATIPAGKALFVPGATMPLEIPPAGRPPLAWPIEGKITSEYESSRPNGSHQGIDIDGEIGEEVRAAAPGRVRWTGRERGYGKTVIIDHGGGISTLYAHASRILVPEDSEVQAGTPIAEVGVSGNAQGAHLHFEVRRDGHPVNPLPFLGGPLGPALKSR